MERWMSHLSFHMEFPFLHVQISLISFFLRKNIEIWEVNLFLNLIQDESYCNHPSIFRDRVF